MVGSTRWAGASAAQAHDVLDQPITPVSSSYRAVFKVGHGCSGSATRGVAVHIPPGFQGAKPMPKLGWTLDVRRENLAQLYTAHEQPMNDDVAEITWSAATPASYLPDAHYDEFVLRGTAPAQAEPLWFKVVQLCESGQQNWIEVPANGTSTRGLKAAAALLEITPGATSGAALPAAAKAAVPTPAHHH